jgi:hypothetical protein
MVAAISRATAAVCSSDDPSGMLRITWNSLLLSKGSIFTFTQPMPTVAIAPNPTSAVRFKNRLISASLRRWNP